MRCRSGCKHWLAPLFISTLILCLAGGAGPSEAYSTKYEIAPTVGYMSSETIRIAGGKLEFESSQSVGLVLDFDMWQGAELEVAYYRQDTGVTFSDSSGTVNRKLFDAGLDFLQVGATLGARKGRTLTFSSVSIGLTHFNPKGVDASNSWKLSLTAGIGTKIYLANHVGVRLHGLLIPTFLSAGSDIFCYEDVCYSKLESGAMLQWLINVGLVVSF